MSSTVSAKGFRSALGKLFSDKSSNDNATSDNALLHLVCTLDEIDIESGEKTGGQDTFNFYVDVNNSKINNKQATVNDDFFILRDSAILIKINRYNGIISMRSDGFLLSSGECKVNTKRAF